MSEIMDIRLQHHLAQEYYRQQMFQRIPGNNKLQILIKFITPFVLDYFQPSQIFK